jgi:mono/diheme cytochrome c family protein
MYVEPGTSERQRSPALLAMLALSVAVTGGLSGLGCNTLDDPIDDDDLNGRLVIPIDERPVTRAVVPPPAISGGTLRVTSDGRFAVAADPDRDTLSVVDLPRASLLHTIALEPGSEPGRLTEDATGGVHAALRGSGRVVSIDPQTGAVLEQRAVCKRPRGIAFEARSGLLHVACAEGALVSLPAAGGPIVRRLQLEPDARDVLVRGDELWVTRFKSAEVVRIGAQGQQLNRERLVPQRGNFAQFEQAAGQGHDSLMRVDRSVTLESLVAWKATETSDGGAMIVHQQAITDEISLDRPEHQASPYGGASGGTGNHCGSIVRTRITTIRPDGSQGKTYSIATAPLPVDIAVSPTGAVAVAQAGTAEPGVPRPFFAFKQSSEFPSIPSVVGAPAAQGVSLFLPPGGSQGANTMPVGLESPTECWGSDVAVIDAPTTAVAFTRDGVLVAQSREPSQLWIARTPNYQTWETVALSHDSRLDTGHEIFHRDAGAGIACASCHPEGSEDGHVWQFSGIGLRRTQALNVGLRDTAPFHWDGDLADVGALMSEVFVERMGGIRQTRERLDELADWLFALPVPPAIRAQGDPGVEHGRALFESAEVGCTSCHAGAHFTDNRSMAVGTLPSGAALQVPSLVAIGYRAPFMHDGCAATLRERFDPACGGAAHGNTSQLTPDQITDLVAYLESL